MAAASESGHPSQYAPASIQLNMAQPSSGIIAQQLAYGSSQTERAAPGVPTNTSDLSAAFSNFLGNASQSFDENNMPQSLLSGMQLAEILGLMPQQLPPGNEPPSAQPQGKAHLGQEKIAPQPSHPNTNDDNSRSMVEELPADDEPQAAVLDHRHQQQLMLPPDIPAQARPCPPHSRWAQPAMASVHWQHPSSSCEMLSQQQPPGAQPPAHYAGAPTSASVAQPHSQGPPSGMQPTMSSAPGSAPAQPPASGPTGNTATVQGAPGMHPPSGASAAASHVPIHHPAAAAMRGYPYGPYGEPCPYPPHGRPPPGAYHHPGMPGPHAHLMAYHPGYPPLHHMPHRGPYYPHDPRGPPMAPCHPGYPPPAYYRSHPGMPPPHPAYHYMPTPYGGHHPSMHPGMYHSAPGMQHPQDVHHRDGAASATSGGTAVCAGVGSDGGSDPAARQVAAKLQGSSGGSESEDVGLEAVITLQPRMPNQEDEMGGPEAADRMDGGMDGDAGGRMVVAVSAAGGPGGELISDGGGPVTHMHKAGPWAHMGPVPGVGGGYEWPHSAPLPPHMMPGYSPMHPPGGWVYPPYDPMAAAMHHPNMMMGSDLHEDDTVGLEYQFGPRRRPSQSSLGVHGVLQQQQQMAGGRRSPYAQVQQPGGYPMMFASKAPCVVEQSQRSDDEELAGHGSGLAVSGQMQHSGSLGQLLSALGDSGQGYVSRRTQRLKKRRSSDLAGQSGTTPDPFALAVAAAERAAMGRDSSIGSGAPLGLPPMFPGSGGARRSSNGSDRTALLGRSGLPPLSSRQRSDPGYLIEAIDQGGGWGPGGGAMVGPMAGLGQLVHFPQHMQQPVASQEETMLRRTSGNGSGGGGRAINLPKRFDDTIITLEYPKGPPPAYAAPRRPHIGYKPGVPAHQDGRGMDAPYELHPADVRPLEEHQQDDEDDEEWQEPGHGEAPDDSDEDYEAGIDRRGFRYGRSAMGGFGAAGADGAPRKRKAPMSREEPPQPEKKRKARDPATISKVVSNCVTILRMVGHDLVYEKEIRNALGNNPDTSKALRLLMNQGKLVRTGQGGRGNPFCYRCTALGISTLQRIEECATPGADPSAGPNQEQRAAAVAVAI